jgi:hypothetical protein
MDSSPRIKLSTSVPEDLLLAVRQILDLSSDTNFAQLARAAFAHVAQVPVPPQRPTGRPPGVRNRVKATS